MTARRGRRRKGSPAAFRRVGLALSAAAAAVVTFSFLVESHPSRGASRWPQASDPPPRRHERAAAEGAPASAFFDAAFLRRSAEYNRAKVVFFLNARAIRWAVYLTLILTPLVPALAAGLARRVPRKDNLRVFVLAWLVLLVLFAVTLPISFASSFLHEHHYGLSRQSLGSWLADAAKGFVLWGATLSLLTVLFFALRRRFPRGGWAVLGVATAAVAMAATFVYPVVVDPLFYRFRPLDDAALRQDLLAMAGEEGIRLERLLVMEASAKTVRENAYFTGLGRTKRVVLWDNLLENASPAEVRQVFAHELGHWSRGHILRGVALSAVALPLLCWVLWWAHGRLARVPRLGLDGPTDPAGIPLLWLLLSLALFLSSPVQNAISRGFEREADRVALELTEDPQTFVESERRMSVRNLSWVDPPALWKWLFWTHPTTLERIRMAQAWKSGGR